MVTTLNKDFEAPAAGQDEAAPRLCKCGRAPWRKGQRNCIVCNREANRRYRDSLKRQTARLSVCEAVPG